MGGYSPGHCSGLIVPQSGTDQAIFPQVVEILTLLESVSQVTFCHRCYLPGSACRCLGVLPRPRLHPLRDRRGVMSPIQLIAPVRHLPGEAQGWQAASIWDLPSTDFPGLPGAPSTSCHQPSPARRGAFLERQLKAICQGKTPDLLRLPRLTWDPPATQNRRVQLPPPPPESDKNQQTTAQNQGPGEQETQRLG